MSAPKLYIVRDRDHGRSFRVAQAARLGIRLVPVDPDTAAFPFVPFPCDRRPQPCACCRRAGTSSCTGGLHGA